jgi:opacity protein-like surface antigen
MKRLKILWVTLSIFIFSIISLYGQIPIKPVTVQLGGGIGLVSPMGDYGGSTIDYYAGTKYGMSTGFNIHGKARLGFLGFDLFGELDYAWFSNNGNAEPGPELHFSIPMSPLTPYLSGIISLNTFSGDATFQGTPRVPSADYSMQTTERVGLGLGAGIIWNIGSSTKMDIGVQYNFLNAFGKSWDDINPTISQRVDTYLALNDAKDPQYFYGSKIDFVNSSRAINTLSLSATLMFGL